MAIYLDPPGGAPDNDLPEWRQMAARVRNWGRWGDDDQLGTLNHISEEAVRHAASLVRRGTTIRLGVPINADGPQGATGLRRNPVHVMTIHGGDEGIAEHLEDWGGAAEASVRALYTGGPARYTDDWILMPCQAGTQWDALSHVYYDGRLYNGYPSSAVTGLGATRNSIESIALVGGVTGRGVLLDVARHRGIDHLPASEIIYPAELDAVVASQGVEIRTGDIVVLRTGWWRKFRTGDGESWFANSPGLSWRCAEWLYDRNAAAVASDTMGVERQPPEDGVRLNFHMIALRDMGMMLGEIWDLEALGADCAADSVYEFLLVAAALPITGGVGTPTNPIAIK